MKPNRESARFCAQKALHDAAIPITKRRLEEEGCEVQTTTDKKEKTKQHVDLWLTVREQEQEGVKIKSSKTKLSFIRCEIRNGWGLPSFFYNKERASKWLAFVMMGEQKIYFLDIAKLEALSRERGYPLVRSRRDLTVDIHIPIKDICAENDILMHTFIY